MTTELRVKAGNVFDELATLLDISTVQFEAAVERYQAVGKWLNEEDTLLAEYEPDIYPQGSFLLGTVIRPINNEDEYDIDLVCELRKLRREDVKEKQQLMDMVGARLRESEIYRRMLEQKKRCWRLNYAEGTRFHMDILPAIPDRERIVLAREAGTAYTTDPILITDKEKQDWLKSNPKGYAEWFKDQMKEQFLTEREKVAALTRAKVEDVPEYKVKTTLQRSIQILKRHRDMMFDGRKDKPVSIIITTLAAQSYRNEPDIVTALQNIVNEMPSHIQMKDGAPYIPNPTRSEENYADSWKDNETLERNFREWLEKVKSDLDRALLQGNLDLLLESIEPIFEEKLVKMAYSRAFETQVKRTPKPEQEPPLVNINRGPKPWRP